MQTDQSELATEILKRKLSEDLKRPVVLGNISAGSWGPPNELAYLKRYGLFDADVVVIVLSSHDYVDVPTFVPVVDVDPSFPGHKPVSALWEGFDRYVLSRFRKTSNEGFVATTGPAKQADIDACMSALREMIRMGRERGAKVIVALHLDRAERLASPQEGHDYFVREAKADGVTPVELGAAFEAAGKAGEEPYRDNVHPNATGQRIIAATLLPVIEGEVRGGPATTRGTR